MTHWGRTCCWKAAQGQATKAGPPCCADPTSRSRGLQGWLPSPTSQVLSCDSGDAGGQHWPEAAPGMRTPVRGAGPMELRLCAKEASGALWGTESALRPLAGPAPICSPTVSSQSRTQHARGQAGECVIDHDPAGCRLCPWDYTMHWNVGWSRLPGPLEGLTVLE